MVDKRRGRRDPAGTRAALLDAALAEFALHGRAGARTQAIAERAGVNKQLISHHFGGKDGLYRALVDRWLEEEADYATPGTPLEDVLAAYIEGAGRHRALHKLLVRASLEGEDAGGGLTADDLDDMRRRQRDGEITDELDPAFVLLALQALASIGLVFAGDVHRLTGMDAESEEFSRWHQEQARAVVARLARPDKLRG